MPNLWVNLYHLEILRVMDTERLEDLLQDIQFLKSQPINPSIKIKEKIFKITHRNISVHQEYEDANWHDMNSLRYHISDSGYIWNEQSRKVDYGIIGTEKYSKQEVKKLRNQQT